MRSVTTSFSALLLVSLVLLMVFAQSTEAAKTCRNHSKHKNVAKSNKVLSTSSSSSDDYATHTTELSKSAASSRGAKGSSVINGKATGKKLLHDGLKAGVSGGESLKWLSSDLGWYNTWTPNPNTDQNTSATFVSMCWGLGRSNHDKDAERFEEFKKIKAGTYKVVSAWNEIDFVGQGSSGYISPAEAAKAWEQHIVPHGKAGSYLLSPSCAKQQDETWLGPFLDAVETQPDAINVHIFKNKASEIRTVLDHYAKYNKPMWITELACIDYSSGTKYCSQEETTRFVQEAVKLLEGDDRVIAYAWSDANNGPSCTLTNERNALSTTGNLFKSTLSRLVKRSTPGSMRRHRFHY